MYIKTTMNNTCKTRRDFLYFALFIYWATLVVWQNIGEYTTRSFVDTMIKVCLLLWLVFWYFLTLQNPRINVYRLQVWSVFVITQIITLLSEREWNLSIVVAFVFPSLFSFLSYVYGHDYKITRKHYETFLNSVIVVVVYAALYAVLFKTDQFLSAFSISSAYGNELTSFFVSNHEYGMYLLGGIVACIVCLEWNRNAGFFKKLFYCFCLVLFIPNLVLTFSRTSMLALAIFLIIYMMFRGKSRLKITTFTVVFIGALLIVVWSDFREFVFKIVLKENNDAGRGDLYALAVEYFKEGTLWQRCFGRGIGEARNYFESELSHGSVHNGYLQVMVYYGIAGLAFMVGFLLCRFVAAVKLIRRDRFAGVLSLGLVLACASLMFTNTSILFNSPIDSFFLTIFTIIMPKYFENGLKIE